MERLYTPVPAAILEHLQHIEPVIVQNRRDMWVWDSNDMGRFTVKDAYTWLQERNQTPTSLLDWRWVWRLKVPERIRIFIWLLLHNSIQTNSHRFRCNLSSSPSCARCSAAKEDALHCLRDCPHSREIWMRAGALAWPGFQVSGCTDWVSRHAQGTNGIKFIACLWGAWKWRNNMIFEDSPWPVHEAWRRICHEHDEIMRFTEEDQIEDDRTMMSTRWNPPGEGTVNLCLDGSFSRERICMGSGGLARDSQGRWLAGFFSHMGGGNALLAEAMALKIGLQIAWDKGWRKVQCTVDCGTLVQALNDVDSRIFLPILDDILELMARNWYVSLSTISRECNQPADWLARKGASSPNVDLCILEVPPPEVEILLLRDRLALS